MAQVGGITESHRSKLEIEKLARFAVDEHNKKAEKVVAGIKSYITLVATDGDKKKLYEAQVSEKPWENFKELLELKQLLKV